MSKNYNWYKIANTVADIPFSPEGLAEIAVNGKQVCVGLFKEKLFACAAKCPHAGGTLAHGYIDGTGNIVCPLHRYKFSPENGRNTTGEGYFLKNLSRRKKRGRCLYRFR